MICHKTIVDFRSGQFRPLISRARLHYRALKKIIVMIEQLEDIFSLHFNLISSILLMNECWLNRLEVILDIKIKIILPDTKASHDLLNKEPTSRFQFKCETIK